MGNIAVALYPNAADVFNILGSVLVSVMPAGFKAVRGQVNRVPEPKDLDFSVMWPISTPRLGTNVDAPVDCVFTGAISGTTLTVSAVSGNPLFPGKLLPGGPVFGVNVAAGTTVVRQLGGTPGGVGTYEVSAAQAVGSETMAGGVEYLTEPVEVVVQLDFHGPNAWDNSATWANLFRDGRGVILFNEAWEARFGNRVHGLQPLFCDDPKQVPFTNDQDQYEDRFVVYAHMQANQTIGMPQQFATSIVPTLINASELPTS